MSVAKRLFWNFALLFSSNVVGQLFFLIGMIHLARVVGPATFGLWNLAQAWMLYLLRIDEMGLEVIGIRTIARDSSELRPVVWNVIMMRVGVAILLMLLVTLASVLSLLPVEGAGIIVIFALTLFPYAVVLEWVFEAHQSVLVVSIARILKGVVFGGLVLLLVNSDLQLIDSVYYYVASISVSAVFVGIAAWKTYRFGMPTFRLEKMKRLIIEAYPVGLASLMWQYSLFIGTILAGYLAAPESLGYYTAAHRLLVFVWAYGIVTSMRVVLPQMSILYRESKEVFGDFVMRCLRLAVFVSLPLGVCAVAGGREVIHLLYGQMYQQSGAMFEILSLALVIAIIRSTFEVGLIASNRQYLYLGGMLGLGGAYTLLTFVFLKLWGIEGVVWAALVAESGYALYIFTVFSLVGFKEIIATLWKPMIVGGITLALLIITGTKSLLLVIAGGCGIYMILLWSVGWISKSDIKIIGAMISAQSGVKRSSAG